MIKVMVHGREMNLSEEQLTAILEEHFERKMMETEFTAKVTTTPTEGNWFIVRPKMIDQSLFAEKRQDIRQEKARCEILKAFAEMQKHPEKYAEPFKTLYPARAWAKNKGKTLQELQNLAKIIGDDEANETEQALEWAQRIHNGESWEMVCNNPDKARSYRAIQTKYPGLHRIVGGSTDAEAKCKTEATNILDDQFMYFDKIGCTVPLVVSRKNIPG